MITNVKQAPHHLQTRLKAQLSSWNLVQLQRKPAKRDFLRSPMCRARKSARHLEDQVTPILCVRLSAWEQRLAKLESSCGGAAHSPQNSRKQLHPAESSACSPASSSPPLFSSSSSALLVWSCSLRAALRPLCARRFLLVFTRPERKKKRERESPSSSPPPLLPH